MNDALIKRPDGKYEEILGGRWIAEYSEDSETGLWELEIFNHDTAEWHNTDYISLEEARRAAQNYYDQV